MIGVRAVAAGGWLPLSTFAGIVVATLFAWLVNDTLAPHGPRPLNLMVSVLVWYFVFWFIRRTLTDLRPDV